LNRPRSSCSSVSSGRPAPLLNAQRSNSLRLSASLRPISSTRPSESAQLLFSSRDCASCDRIGNVSITAIADAPRSLCHGCSGRVDRVAVTVGDRPDCVLPTSDGCRQTTRSQRRASPTDESRTAGDPDLELPLLAVARVVRDDDAATVGRVARTARPEGVNGSARSGCWRLPMDGGRGT
jgi:hypothetical protein